jgi:hypothetical protein
MAACGTALLVAVLSPGAHADEWNRKTYLTFSGPVEMPGVTLPAGTYTFELADPDAAHHVIRVTQKDTNRHMGLFMAIPMDRVEAPESPVIMFTERPKGAPEAIQAWFYPGERTGEEFVYPPAQAARIAAANGTTVLASNGADRNARESESDRMAAMKHWTIGRVDGRGELKGELKKDQRVAPPPSSAAASNVPQSVGTSGTGEQTPRTHARSLPRTASDLTAVELWSGLCFAGAFAIRRVRHSRQQR